MHAMIDLETWSSRPTACVVQIAAVLFEPVCGGKVKVEEAFNTYVVPDGQKAHVSPDTMLWWLKQSDAARRDLVRGLGGAVPLGTALHGLQEWYKLHGPTVTWCHGLAFDIPILNHAYAQEGLDPPWYYRSVRDTRTWYMAQGDPSPAVQEKVERLLKPEWCVPHNALYDATLQALQVQDVA